MDNDSDSNDNLFPATSHEGIPYFSANTCVTCVWVDPTNAHVDAAGMEVCIRCGTLRHQDDAPFGNEAREADIMTMLTYRRLLHHAPHPVHTLGIGRWCHAHKALISEYRRAHEEVWARRPLSLAAATEVSADVVRQTARDLVANDQFRRDSREAESFDAARTKLMHDGQALAHRVYRQPDLIFGREFTAWVDRLREYDEHGC